MAGDTPGPKFLWDEVEDLEPLIDEYFDKMDEEKRPYTVTGLSLHLKTSRKVLMEYQKREKFSSLLIHAKARCENYAEEQLYTSPHVTGPIFSLKNNYGWTDKISLDADVNSTVTSIDDDTLNEEIERLTKELAEKERI